MKLDCSRKISSDCSVFWWCFVAQSTDDVKIIRSDQESREYFPPKLRPFYFFVVSCPMETELLQTFFSCFLMLQTASRVGHKVEKQHLLCYKHSTNKPSRYWTKGQQVITTAISVKSTNSTPFFSFLCVSCSCQFMVWGNSLSGCFSAKGVHITAARQWQHNCTFGRWAFSIRATNYWNSVRNEIRDISTFIGFIHSFIYPLYLLIPG